MIGHKYVHVILWTHYVLQVWLHLPMENPAMAAAYYYENGEEFKQLNGSGEMNTWEW